MQDFEYVFVSLQFQVKYRPTSQIEFIKTFLLMDFIVVVTVTHLQYASI